MTTDIKGLVKRLRAQGRKNYGLSADAADALEAMAGEVAGLKEAHAAELKLCDEELFRVNKQWSDMCKRAEAAEAERDRLKAALEKFIAEANTAPKRIIGNGIGGQTMEATLKASGRLISEWQIERLRNSMELHVEGCREEL